MDWIERLTSTDEGMKLFQRERLEVEITELICKSLEDKKITRADLARKLGTSRAYVRQLLRDGNNLTLETMSDIFTALGQSVRLIAQPLSISTPDLYVIEKPIL